MYKSCHMRLSSNPHIILVRLVMFGHVYPKSVKADTNQNIQVKIIFHNWFFCGHFLVILLFAVSFSLSSTSLIASATVTAAVLILSSNTLFSTGEGRASSPRLKSPRNPRIVAIPFMLKLGRSPGLKGQKSLHRNTKHFLETYN